MATTGIKDNFDGGSDNGMKVNSDGSINVDVGGSGTPISTNLTEVGGSTIVLGQTTESASLPVTIASNQSAIPVSGAVTANQGMPGTLAGGWPVEITDGTHILGTSANPIYVTLNGVVMSVTATSPLASTGGTNPNISIQVATSLENGYLADYDWITFNSKQPAGNYITALTGDGTASGPGIVPFTLASVNSNVGSFGTPTQSGTFTVNAKGLITAASNTSIQISEAQVTNLTTDLSARLTSVALTMPSIFSVSGSPVSGSTPGTLAVSFNTESANTVLAGPSSGSAAAPTFRTLTLADFPVTSGSSFLTSGTTYTTPSTITANTQFKFTLIGGGGGSAGMATTNGRGTGGGGGGGGILYISGLTPSTAYAVAIGAAGAAGTSAPTAGGAGGTTTLVIGTTTYSAGGGDGAQVGVSSVGGVPGGAVNCTINITGGWGGWNGPASANAVAGSGGNSPFGFGIGGTGMGPNNFFGSSIGASGYGGGGGGVADIGTAVAGASGTQGCILVEWTN